MKILLIGHGKVNKIINEIYQDDIVGIVDETGENIQSIPQVIIDFSHPSLLDKTMFYAMKYNCPVLIGTTGYDIKKMAQIKELSNFVPILKSSNFSSGISLIKKILTENLDTINLYKKTIIERHNSLKKDTPSGTALMLDEILHTNNIHSFRDPFFVAEHEIVLEDSNEIITITHKVLNRSVFAFGAIKACGWLIKQSPGMYQLEDVNYD